MYIFKKLRPYQKETLEKIKNTTKKFTIISAPTGSGKSFFAGQLAYESHKTLALTHTKSLQSQYASGYDMALLYGKNNYDCLGDKQAKLFDWERLTADDCELPKGEKKWCFENCPYPQARWDFINSVGGVLNYKKFLLDFRLIDDFEPECIFCDEAHMLSDMVTDHAGLQFFWKSKELQKYTEPFVCTDPQPVMFVKAQEWLHRLLENMESSKPLHPNKGGKLRAWKWYKNRTREIEATLGFMQSSPESWYLEADKDSLLIKPLTARFHFESLFNKADKIVLMSATIDKHTLRELGIVDYEFITIPNVWPAPLRLIHDLKAPKMGWNSSEQDWIAHSEVIAYWLNKRPPEHTGLIHTPSKHLAYSLRDRLQSLTDRQYFIPNNGDGTEEVYAQWQLESLKNQGTIAISWMSWEGWDCGSDYINIVAKTPFVDFSSAYDKARFLYDGKAGYSRVAQKFMQGLGRIRRGNPDDYGDSKFVGIADGNWSRVKKYVNKDILQSVR